MRLAVATVSADSMSALPKELPDVIGFQGLTPELRSRLESLFPDHAFFGMGTSPQRDGVENPIAFRKSLLALHSIEQFWLSDTPQVPGSRFLTDLTSAPRCCTAVVLMTRDDYRPFRLYNTETVPSPLAQVQGVSLILSRMAEDEDKYPGSPVILTGAFHDAPGSKTESAVTKFQYRDLRLYAAAANADGANCIYTNGTIVTTGVNSAEVLF